MNQLICYCFQYTEQAIIEDMKQNKGVSTILNKITEAKSHGRCNCYSNHPEHRWCLSDVRRIVEKLH